MLLDRVEPFIEAEIAFRRERMETYAEDARRDRAFRRARRTRDVSRPAHGRWRQWRLALYR